MAAVGEVRPSQLLFTFGVGSTIDLPGFSALVMGLDFWDKAACLPVAEPRLLAAVRRVVGASVGELRLAPVPTKKENQDSIGVPVVPFPRWMRCTRCGCLAPLEEGLFEKREERRQPLRFVHTHCDKAKNSKYPPHALPVRFVLACGAGHLTDVPWNDFVHDGQPCKEPRLYMSEQGITGDISGIRISCACSKYKYLVDLMYYLQRNDPVYKCNSLYPHLRTCKPDTCEEKLSLISLGASNLWFPQTLSVLSIPDTESELVEYVRSHWDTLSRVTSVEVVNYVANPHDHPKLMEYNAEDVLRVIQAEQSSTETDSETDTDDIKLPEWNVFIGKTPIEPMRKLEIHPVDAPFGFQDIFDTSMLLPRLSEVRAMYGFTRLRTQQELDLGIVTKQSVAPLTRSSPEWLPAYESHGEGIFVRLKEGPLQAWEKHPSVMEHAKRFLLSHKAWRKSRKYKDTEEGFPGMRFILLHSFAHALMQQIVLDCGYTAASIRERLYCRTHDAPGGPMAGFLIYTAAMDSEGTLGGLVSLGTPETLGRYIAQALENMRLCSSDPLCAESVPNTDGRGIHGAACHACLFAPETSCECGNRYLDRNVLVRTFANRPSGLAFRD